MLTRAPALAVLVFLLTFTSAAFARSPSEASRARSYPAPPIRARAAIVIDADNGQVLAGYNIHRRLPMASTTKLMTALLALKMGNLDDRIVVPAAAFDYEADATVMGLRPGEVVTLRQLLYGLLLPSGADAANTIAIHYAGSESNFVALMNREAAALGMHDTHYADDTGLTSVDHYTSAYDLALLAQYMAFMPALIKVTSTRTYYWNGHMLQNVNKVLFWYPGLDGLKPGYTYAAGLCQVLDARRDDRHIIAVTLNTPDLVVDARDLLNFGLRDFTWVRTPLGDSPETPQTGTSGGVPWEYFPASGHYVRGAFLKMFQADGGLNSLGFPRTEPLPEGRNTVQYFQNAALSRSPSGRIGRLALGLTPLPAPRPAATPTPRPPAPTPTPVPAEGTVVPGTGRGTPTPRPRTTPTPHPRITATPSPRHNASAGSSPVYMATAAPFASFVRAHSTLLGRAVGTLRWRAGYGVQQFAYGALVTDGHGHVSMLPLGDRLLAARGWLPPLAGNSYPTTFATEAVLKKIGWLTDR